MWQRTHGRLVGAYSRQGGAELYVRLDANGWRCFIDGQCTDLVPGESQARASAESTLRRRGMIEAGATRVAAAAGQAARAAGGRPG